MTPSTKRASAFEQFYFGGATPHDAIELAIQDHREVAGGMGSVEFVDSLRIAQAMLEEHAELLAALKGAHSELARFLNCCSPKEIRDSFQGMSRAAKRAHKIIAKAEGRS